MHAQSKTGDDERALSIIQAQYAQALSSAAKSTGGSGTTTSGSTSGGSTGSTGTTRTGTGGTGSASSTTTAPSTGTSTARTASGSSTTGSSGTGSSTTGSAGTGSQTGGMSGSGTGAGQTTASRLITDRAAVAAAQVTLDDANANLVKSVLRAPIAGVVSSLGITKGATAATSDTVTITKPGPARVTVDVASANYASVRVGQAVSVTPAGATKTVAGQVASIGLLPTSSTTASSTSYPVIVLVPDGVALASGSRAQASIVIKTVKSAVTVPNSALTTVLTGTARVSVLSAAHKVSSKLVQTGVTGSAITQVTGGLAVGDTIVLADRSASLPSNSSTSNTRVGQFGAGGGLPAGGFGGRPGN